MAHPTRVGRRVGALYKKLGHPWHRVCSISWIAEARGMACTVNTYRDITTAEKTEEIVLTILAADIFLMSRAILLLNFCFTL